MEEKLIRDRMGSPVPQYFNTDLEMFAVQTVDGSTVTNGDVDFSKTKLLRDKLGSVMPQVWDPINHKWVVVTTNGIGGGNGEGGGPIKWDSIPDKPIDFKPSSHTHDISEINGLQDELDTVFTQVSSGKLSLETTLEQMGYKVKKAGDIATYKELQATILEIANSGGNSNDRYGVPIGTIIKEIVQYSKLNVTEQYNITFTEV